MVQPGRPRMTISYGTCALRCVTEGTDTHSEYVNLLIIFPRGTRWRSWLRHLDTNRNVAGSIPDVVTGIFH
jgi:hypothetical protein